VSTGPHTRLGRGRSLAQPDFADDDGRPDERVRALLSGDSSDLQVARALRGDRLLTSVVAVLDEHDAAGGDKDSHMAVVSMINDRGEHGLLAFSGTDSLAMWNPDARPMPASGRDVALAALEARSAALVIDVQGPARRVLAGTALKVLADQLDIEVINALVQSALSGLTADGWADIVVEDAREDGPVDVAVRFRSSVGRHPDGRTVDELARQAAAILSERADLNTLVPGGLGVVAS
jgi:hypothetical protein